MSDAAEARAEFRARGRVQGVYYRASTVREARRLGLRGWVRNEPDGSVSGVAEGPRADVEALLQWARRGPPAARVDGVDVEWGEPTGAHPDFDVRY